MNHEIVSNILNLIWQGYTTEDACADLDLDPAEYEDVIETLISELERT